MRKLLIILAAIAISVPLATAQKVTFGFDKSVDFSKYRTYSYPPMKNAADNAIKIEALRGEVDYHLKNKGLSRQDSGGDLIIVGDSLVGGEVGGRQGTAILPWYADVYTEYGSMWAGWRPAPGQMVLKGGLAIRFLDTTTKKPIWNGTVVQKLDEGGFGKNLKRIQQAIAKLMEKYPPPKESK
jgi:hypothetical protein